MSIAHKLDCPVSFGDCDPAGIVFYPNVYAWMDRTFHDWLRGFGGHAALCDQFEAIGLGLMEAHASFHRPLHDGDVLALDLSVEAWGRKTVRLAYKGHVNGEIAVTGTEVRGLFKAGGNGIVAGEIEALRRIVEADDERRQER